MSERMHKERPTVGSIIAVLYAAENYTRRYGNSGLIHSVDDGGITETINARVRSVRVYTTRPLTEREVKSRPLPTPFQDIPVKYEVFHEGKTPSKK